MKNMKHILLGAAVIGVISFVVLSLTSNAENVGLGVGQPVTLLSSNMPTLCAITNVAQLTVDRASTLGIQINVKGAAAAATGTVTAVFTKSIDGTNWNALATIAVTCSGTTTVSTNASVTVGPAPLVKLSTVTEAAAGTDTNVTVSIYSYSKPNL